MPLKIAYTLDAQQDLDDLWESRFVRGQTVADAVLDEMLERIQDLAEFPEMGRQRDELRPGLRSIRQTSHVIFYVVKGKTLVVLRVAHARRDISSADFEG